MDNSPEMLGLLHQKAEALGLAPRVYLQTMETLDLPRGYTQAQAIQLLQEAGFADVHLTSGFSFTPFTAEDTLFCSFGTCP